MKKIFVILPILAGILFGSCGISVRILTQMDWIQQHYYFQDFQLQS